MSLVLIQVWLYSKEGVNWGKKYLVHTFSYFLYYGLWAKTQFRTSKSKIFYKCIFRIFIYLYLSQGTHLVSGHQKVSLICCSLCLIFWWMRDLSLYKLIGLTQTKYSFSSVHNTSGVRSVFTDKMFCCDHRGVPHNTNLNLQINTAR